MGDGGLSDWHHAGVCIHRSSVCIVCAMACTPGLFSNGLGGGMYAVRLVGMLYAVPFIVRTQTTKEETVPELTDQQATRYVEAGGIGCPYCKDDNGPNGGRFDFYPGAIVQLVTCDACGNRWRDTYHLVSIEPTK